MLFFHSRRLNWKKEQNCFCSVAPWTFSSLYMRKFYWRPRKNLQLPFWIRFKYTWHEITEKGFMFAMPWRWKGMNLNCEGLPMPPPHLLPQGTSLQITDFQVCTFLLDWWKNSCNCDLTNFFEYLGTWREYQSARLPSRKWTYRSYG